MTRYVPIWVPPDNPPPKGYRPIVIRGYAL